MREVWGTRINHIPSVNADMPDWQYVEMRVCAALMTAFNSGKLSGCNLGELVTRVVAELIDHEKKLYVELKPLPEFEWYGRFHSSFIWPYDTVLLEAVHRVLGSLESTRPRNALMLDAGFIKKLQNGKKELTVTTEVKSSTQQFTPRPQIYSALRRLDSRANVSFIVVEKSVRYKNFTNFKLADIATLRRGKRGTSGKFEEGHKLSCARLFNVRIEDGAVTLQGMDGRKPESTRDASQLIFLISLEDINKDAQSI